MTLISYSDWLEAGGTRSQLNRGIAAGSVRRIRRGIVLDVRGGLTPQAEHLARVRAAAPSLERTTLVARQSAAVVHGLPMFSTRLDRVTLIRTGGGHGVIRPLIHARRGVVEPWDAEVVDGIEVTNLARTVADLTRELPFVESVMIVDAALRLGLERDDVLARLTEGNGRRRAARAVRFGDHRAESPGESVSRAIMHLAGLPAPELQHEVLDQEGHVLGRLDFYWADSGLAGEFDGRTKYVDLVPAGSDAGGVMWKEKRRELGISDTGVAVTRWTWPELWDGTMCRRLARGLGVRDVRMPSLTLPPGLGD